MLQKNRCNVLFPPVWFVRSVFGRVGLTCPLTNPIFRVSIVSVGNQNSDGRDPLSWLKMWSLDWLGGSYQIHLDLEPVSTTSSTIDYINMAHNNTSQNIIPFHSIPSDVKYGLVLNSNRWQKYFWNADRILKVKEVVLQAPPVGGDLLSALEQTAH